MKNDLIPIWRSSARVVQKLELSELPNSRGCLGGNKAYTMAINMSLPEVRASHRRREPWPPIMRLVSHELRVPVSLIGGYLDLLASPEVRRDAARFSQTLEELRANVRELNRLVTELQDAGRIAAGHLLFKTERLKVDRFIGESLEAAEPLCRVRKVILDSTVPRVPGYVLADRQYVRTCLLNLIDNAAKYARSSGLIRVDAEVVSGTIEIRVVDEGPGLGTGAADLFEPFSRGDTTKEGIGLGLSLVKEIVEAHGGSVVWSSGDVSHVGFRLPWFPN